VSGAMIIPESGVCGKILVTAPAELADAFNSVPKPEYKPHDQKE